jgi:carbonic anhydrase
VIRYLICLGILFGFSGLQADTPPTPSAPSPAEVVPEQQLLDQTLNFARRHQAFKELEFRQHEDEFVRLVDEGQSPQTLFIGCSDSRIIPELVLNMRPGDLFVIRTAGNFVPPANFQEADGVMATVQYAVEVLNVRHIIICGHSHCGAIKGLFQELDPAKFGILKRWLQFGEQAKKMALLTAKPSTPNEDLYALTEKISVIYQLEHLLSYPFIKRRVDEGKLQLHGWYFRIETGDIFYYDPQQYRFTLLSEKLQTAHAK